VASPSLGSFDALADLYDRFRTGYSPELFDAIADYGLSTGASVLDVACGTGLVSDTLANRGYRVTGIDVSVPMLERARRRVPAATFVTGDAEKIPFAAASFDAATSGQAFHWFDRAKALGEMMRVVRPGGVIAIWWKELMRGDAVRLVREEVAHELGMTALRPIMADEFDAFDASSLVDRRLRVIPWIVTMTVASFIGYEGSRARARSAYGDQLDAYLSLLETRLGPPETPLSLGYLHLLYLGRVPEGRAEVSPTATSPRSGA
jgi:ubiquinone/menaquinone biosynthesis C-methylase UbiE